VAQPKRGPSSYTQVQTIQVLLPWCCSSHPHLTLRVSVVSQEQLDLLSGEVFACENSTLFFHQDDQIVLAIGKVDGGLETVGRGIILHSLWCWTPS